MDAQFFFIDVRLGRIVFYEESEAEEFTDSERPVTFRSIVPVLTFDASGSKVRVLDYSALGAVALPPEARPIIV